MPLQGEYEPPAHEWLRGEVERIMSAGTTDVADMEGRPVVLVTMQGKNTGKLRKVPLMRVEHDGQYVLVASMGGAPTHPEWFYNIQANPHVELQDATVTKDYEAREVTGDERTIWWQRAVEAYPSYADYQSKTDRQIPVFVLTEIDR